MKMKYQELALVGMVAAALGAGCGKSEPGRPAAAVTAPAPMSPGETIAHLHWLGKKRIAAGPSATNIMSLWDLPASTRLEAQTLDKLAIAPWRQANTNAPVTNAASAQLRPLLDDLVSDRKSTRLNSSH